MALGPDAASVFAVDIAKALEPLRSRLAYPLPTDSDNAVRDHYIYIYIYNVCVCLPVCFSVSLFLYLSLSLCPISVVFFTVAASCICAPT
jgi:hypothetical protein